MTQILSEHHHHAVLQQQPLCAFAGVGMNGLTLQPALRTLTCDYNCLKRQVQDFHARQSYIRGQTRGESHNVLMHRFHSSNQDIEEPGSDSLHGSVDWGEDVKCRAILLSIVVSTRPIGMGGDYVLHPVRVCVSVRYQLISGTVSPIHVKLCTQ